MKKTRNEAVIKDEKIRLSKQNEAEQFDLDRFRVEQNEEIIRYKFDKEIERERQKAEFDLEKTEKETEAERLINDETIRTMEEKTRVENSFTSISLEKIFIEKAMPAIAEVMAKSMSEVKINMFQHGENMKTPFSFMLAEMMNVLKEIATPILNQNRIEKTESETDKQDLTSAQEGENKVIEQSDIKEED